LDLLKRRLRDPVRLALVPDGHVELGRIDPNAAAAAPNFGVVCAYDRPFETKIRLLEDAIEMSGPVQGFPVP
jgi:hypothetical protein